MKKLKTQLFISLFITFVVFPCILRSQVTDIDRNTYKTILIGSQIWMAENLYVTHYRNGEPIPQVQNEDEWPKLNTGAWCFYDNNPENGKIYGRLYNWYAVNDVRGLAPEGWHVPTDEEWTKLVNYLGGELIAGGKMKTVTVWESPNKDATNISGFNGLPGGVRFRKGYYDDICFFKEIGRFGCFWSSSIGEPDNGIASYCALGFVNSDVSRIGEYKETGMSVRCVKD